MTLPTLGTTFLLVDHENTGKIDFTKISDETTVYLFFGATQQNVPKDYLDAVRKLGERFVQIDLESQGKNALDFHIAFYLGEILTKNNKASCTILSNDKGFDALVNHLRARNLSVSRQATKSSSTTGEKTKHAELKLDPNSLPSTQKEAYDWLKTMQKNKRPRKRKSLINHLHSHFSKKLTTIEIEDFVSQLLKHQAISENNQNLTYHF